MGSKTADVVENEKDIAKGQFAVVLVSTCSVVVALLIFLVILLVYQRAKNHTKLSIGISTLFQSLICGVILVLFTFFFMF